MRERSSEGANWGLDVKTRQRQETVLNVWPMDLAQSFFSGVCNPHLEIGQWWSK